jgi:nicotinate phosphoribosyltransferase
MNTVTSDARGASPLLTDLYQLTMLDAYYRQGMEKPAVFEFAVRRLPQARNFLVAAGLQQVLDYLEGLRFGAAEIEWLASLRRFSPEFLARLRDFRFTGEVYAMREGTVFFASEPVLRVVAPLPQAQLVESRIINLLHYQTLVASKAARCRLAAPRKQLVDFGMRRAHGAEAAALCSRASYLAGFDATATVEASQRFGIPVVGTMAHSFVQAHELEIEAFRTFAACHPQNVALLIDTYDTARGARRAAQLARELRPSGVTVKAVRIDSGDLAVEARRVRDILDSYGEREIQIMVSSALDEYAIAALEAQSAPIDIYCVGTRLAVCKDAPSLDCAYKLQEYGGRLCRKRSQWKETWPGERQVYRQHDAHGFIARDLLCCAREVHEGQALLQRVMTGGRRMAHSPPLSELRSYCKEQLATVPEPLRSLEHVGYSPTKVSELQHTLAAEVDKVAH